MSITQDTRRESYTLVDAKTLCKKIKKIFEEENKSYTARELSVILYENHLIPFPVRQAVAPRLTEMEQEGILKVCGKTKDELTKRNVALYKLSESNEEEDDED